MSDKGRSALADAVGEREPEVGGEELLDVWAADVLVLLDLDHTENLRVSPKISANPSAKGVGGRTWMDLKRARCLAAMSWYMLLTASALDKSRYSLYMLWVPERES